MVNNDNDYQVPATLSQGNRPNQIKLTLDEELKTEGSYTLIIPAGMIQRVIFTETTEENAENTTVLLTSPEIKYDYTIGLDFAPTGITPAAGKVFSLKDFTIKFAEGTVPQLNEESASQAYLLNSKNGNQVAATLAIGTNTTEVIATLAEEVSAEGNYTLVIPARMIQQTSMDEGDGTAEPTVKTEYAPNLKYDYTIGHDYEPASITPAEGTVSSLHEFVLQFVADTTYATINTENEDKAYLADNNGESVEEATLAAGDNPNEIKVTLANEVNTKGTYTLVIPAKMIQQSAGEENPTYSKYPEKPNTKTGMREIIRMERLNELACEGKRFWDLRRWKKELPREVKGWYVQGETAQEFYRVTTLYLRSRYSFKDYLWPLKVETVLKDPNLGQSPGW